MRSVLITGSSTGIGRETALRLAGAGWRVFAGVRREADGSSLREEFGRRRSAGGGVGAGAIEPVILDVTRDDHIGAAAGRVGAAVGEGGLAGLVNNAGIPVVGPVEAVGMEAWRRQFEVNFFGAVAVTRAVLPLVRRARGRVVLVSSIAGLVGQPFLSPYCASKHAMEAVGDALRMELAPDGVGVTLIEPGAIKTPIWRRGEENTRAVEAGMDAEVSARYLARMERVRAMALEAERKGLDPSVCARAIERALTARRAPARVILGMDARIGAWAKRLLPSGVFDAVLRRAMGV